MDRPVKSSNASGRDAGSIPAVSIKNYKETMMLVYNKNMMPIEKFNKHLLSNSMIQVEENQTKNIIGFGVGLYKFHPCVFFVSDTAKMGDYVRLISWPKYIKLKKELKKALEENRNGSDEKYNNSI